VFWVRLPPRRMFSPIFSECDRDPPMAEASVLSNARLRLLPILCLQRAPSLRPHAPLVFLVLRVVGGALVSPATSLSRDRFDMRTPAPWRRFFSSMGPGRATLGSHLSTPRGGSTSQTCLDEMPTLAPFLSPPRYRRLSRLLVEFLYTR